MIRSAQSFEGRHVLELYTGDESRSESSSRWKTDDVAWKVAHSVYQQC